MHDQNSSDYNINSNRPVQRLSRPEWLKIKPPGGSSFKEIKNTLKSRSLHTVCEEARCPNLNECWNCGTATFMILGDVCNRNCGFCAVTSGKPISIDPLEPANIAAAIKQMRLKHAVITSVTRDDLPDGGSQAWAEVIKAAKSSNPETTIEVLIPDFEGNYNHLDNVLDAKPDILNHNIETAKHLYPRVRPKADYHRSLNLLKYSKEKGFRTKTGFMVGLGEQKEDIEKLLIDLKGISIDIITIGQYLQPTKSHLPVQRFVHPDEFAEYKNFGLKLGIKHIESGPLVRSSYHADKHA